MDPYVFWAILCLGLAVAIFFVEVFVPSGGLLGFLSMAALITGIVLLFKVSTLAGLIAALVALVAVPAGVALALKIWPHTPVFRWLVLGAPASGTATGEGAGEELVGAEGKCLTDLRPIGTCIISGRRFDCISEEGVIRSGEAVRVVSADGFQVKVRRTNGATTS